MITVKGLTRSYGDFRAVDEISFTINEGEITGLLGPNGAGKTTTLRMLSGYLKPDSGSILYDGVNAAEDPIGIKKITGYLPESAPLYGDMMVFDYLCYIAELRAIDNAPDRIREIASLCRIREVMHKNISELSKGYKQRVGIAHAMIHDPAVLILDEPTSGLDPVEIIEIRNLIKELGKKKTVILSTHILPEVEATCSKVIIINRGRIVADDATSKLQSSAGRDRSIIIRVSGTGYEGLESMLRSVQGVDHVAAIDDSELASAIVTVSGDTDARADIFHVVCSKGWVLYEMKQEHTSLENIFRELTTGGENEQI